jgi:hypothetical protein
LPGQTGQGNPGMQITYVVGDEVENWYNIERRCIAPARAIQRAGRHGARVIRISELNDNDSTSQHVCATSDVLVVHRNLWGRILANVQHWRAHDQVVLVDFDEAYQLYEPGDAEFAFWQRGQRNGDDKVMPPPLEQFKWGLQLVNGMAVSSKRLADDWSAYGKIDVIPSYIDLDNYQNLPAESHEGVILEWHGRPSGLRSWQKSGLLGAVKQVLEQRPQCQLVIYTDPPEAGRGLAFASELTSGQVSLRSWKQSGWPEPLNSVDIGLVPLSRPVDLHGDCGVLVEYMVKQIPWLASHSPACNELGQYGILIENSAVAWQHHLLDVIDRLPDYRLEAAQIPYLFGISQSLDENVHRLVNLYGQLAGPTNGKTFNSARDKEGSMETYHGF